MALNVGINVREVDGSAVPALQGAPTSVAAFLGLTERGIPHRPVRIATLGQFRERFGRPRDDGYLAYALEGFFLNGGTEAYVSRVAGGASRAAGRNLDDRRTPAAATLRVAAGRRGEADPGAWGERLSIAVRDDPRLTTGLQADTEADATSARLESVAGLHSDSVVCFQDGEDDPVYRRITRVDATERTVHWADDAAIADVLSQASTRVSSAEFRLLVRYRAGPQEEPGTVEDWRHLSMQQHSDDYAPRRVNHPATGSLYITLADVSGTAPAGAENPAVATDLALGDGSEAAPDSTDYAGEAAAKRGFHALDTARVQLLAAPDAHVLDAVQAGQVMRAALDYCAGRGDCCFVGSAPDRGAATATPRAVGDYTQLESDYAGSVKDYAAALHGRKVYGALYSPWIQVMDPLARGPAPVRFVPADGHLMGIYARTDRERGIWKSPAGNAAQVRGALALAADFNDVQHTDLVRNGLVNAIRRQAGAGIVVAGSRTLSSDSRWWFVNVRLLFNFVKATLRDGLRFVRQEPHSEALRRRVRLNVVTPFLLGLWRRGAFGSDAPEQVFSVKCDAENNPQAQVDQGNFFLEVYFYPVRPVETISIIVGQQPSGASAGEA